MGEHAAMLPVGRGLNERVAGALGWTRKRSKIIGRVAWHDPQGRLDSVPRFSEDIAAVWPAAEQFGIGVLPWDDEPGKRYVAGYEAPSTSVCWYERVLYGDHEPVTWAYGDTAPHAIALALLKAAAGRPGRAGPQEVT